jgi:hypothetical protein
VRDCTGRHGLCNAWQAAVWPPAFFVCAGAKLRRTFFVRGGGNGAAACPDVPVLPDDAPEVI